MSSLIAAARGCTAYMCCIEDVLWVSSLVRRDGDAVYIWAVVVGSCCSRLLKIAVVVMVVVAVVTYRNQTGKTRLERLTRRD